MVSNHLRFCAERGRLLDLLSISTVDYSRSATELGIRMATMLQADYECARLEVERARLVAEHFRDALLQHRKEHDC